VFDLSHVKSAQFSGQTLSFNVTLETVDDRRNSSFVLENFNKFLIHPLDSSQHASTNAEEAPSWVFLGVIFGLI
jgi:hypothetical protein